MVPTICKKKDIDQLCTRKTFNIPLRELAIYTSVLNSFVCRHVLHDIDMYSVNDYSAEYTFTEYIIDA